MPISKWSLLLLLVLMSLSACAPVAGDETSTAEATEEIIPTATEVPPSGTLTLALTTQPNSLDIVEASERQARNASWPLYDTLIWIEPDGSKHPALAERWEISDDGTEYTFYLRQDVTYHNGEPFNADAVVYSWTRATESEGQWADKWRLASAVEKVDEFTVKVTTPEPNALFLSQVFDHWAMVPPGYYEEVGHEEFGKNPVGTGPFKFVEWTEEGIVYEANTDYWQAGQPRIQNVIYRWIPDAAERVAAIQSGEIDIAPRLSAEDGESLTGVEGVQIVSYPVDRVYYIGFNNITTGVGTPVEDPLVRRAMNHAVDRQGIIDEFFPDFGRPATGLVTPVDLGYDYSIKPFEYDPDLARELLEEAGYADGFEIDMACPEDAYLNFEEVCQTIVDDLAEVDIIVNLEIIPSDPYWDMESKKELPPLFGDSWSEISGEALPRLEGALGGHDASFSAWDSQEIRDLLRQIRITVNDQQRIELYKQLQAMMIEDPPFIYLYELFTTEAATTRVQNYRPRFAENYYLVDVWIDDEAGNE